ncbi:MAG: hypothetical protein FWF60_03875 [Oscillospiraceae bacterium]|nr:hypothetical protein [Oscillospiraceae bacterium]
MIDTANTPDTLFRQAMEAPLTPEGEALARRALHSLAADLLARRDLRHDPRLRNMLLACRLRLRALQNTVLCARAEGDFLPCPCELREWAQDLCFAANMLLAPLGRQVRFSAPEEPMECMCAPRDIAWLLLELVCNSALHCPGETIHVSLAPRGKKRARAYVLTVACEGQLDLDALHAAGLREGSGIAAMQRIAWLHRGALLWLERGGKSIAALRLAGNAGIERGGGRIASHPYSELPDYVDLLSDPCSQVYIALAPAVGT